MTVDTGFGLVRQIGMGFGYITGINTQPDKNAQNKNHRHLPLIGGDEFTEKLHDKKDVGVLFKGKDYRDNSELYYQISYSLNKI
jgi:hypothetical protein